MPGIEVPVSAPGLAATQQGFEGVAKSSDKAAGSMTKTSATADRMGKSWSALKNKMGSGEVIRNTAASFALMAVQGNGAMEKVAGLAGALASIPGPIGIVASGVAAAATIFNIYSKSAENAAKETEELKKELQALGQAKGAAQKSLADAIGGAAKTHGTGLRKAMSMGASQADIDTGLSLTGGDAASSLGIAGALGSSKLDDAGKADVVGWLKGLRQMGIEVSGKTVADAIKMKQDQLESSAPQSAGAEEAATAGRRAASMRGGGIFGPGYGTTNRDTGSSFTQSVLDLAGRDSSNNADLLNRHNAANMSQAGRHNAMLLDKAEAPAIADTGRQFRDAFRGTGTVEAEALRVSTLANTTSTDNLTKAITDLDQAIKDATAKASGQPTEKESVDALFKYGREANAARR